MIGILLSLTILHLIRASTVERARVLVSSSRQRRLREEGGNGSVTATSQSIHQDSLSDQHFVGLSSEGIERQLQEEQIQTTHFQSGVGGNPNEQSQQMQRQAQEGQSQQQPPMLQQQHTCSSARTCDGCKIAAVTTNKSDPDTTCTWTILDGNGRASCRLIPIQQASSAETLCTSEGFRLPSLTTSSLSYLYEDDEGSKGKPIFSIIVFCLASIIGGAAYWKFRGVIDFSSSRGERNGERTDKQVSFSKAET